MSAENPFQIPSCFKLDIELRRRERFKKTVVTAVIVSAALVVGLLIEGCVSEKSQNSAADKSADATSQISQPLAAQNPQSTPQTAPLHNVPPPTSPAATVPPKAAPPVASTKTTGATVYYVKSGDTLTRIAKTHGTTVKALKSANGLGNDIIVVGEKLKIPSA